MPYPVIAQLVCLGAVVGVVILAPAGRGAKAAAVLVYLSSLLLERLWPQAALAALLIQVIEAIAIITYLRLIDGR